VHHRAIIHQSRKHAFYEICPSFSTCVFFVCSTNEKIHREVGINVDSSLPFYGLFWRPPFCHPSNHRAVPVDMTPISPFFPCGMASTDPILAPPFVLPVLSISIVPSERNLNYSIVISQPISSLSTKQYFIHKHHHLPPPLPLSSFSFLFPTPSTNIYLQLRGTTEKSHISPERSAPNLLAEMDV